MQKFQIYAHNAVSTPPPPFHTYLYMKGFSHYFTEGSHSFKDWVDPWSGLPPDVRKTVDRLTRAILKAVPGSPKQKSLQSERNGLLKKYGVWKSRSVHEGKRDERRDAEGAAARKWAREVAMLSPVARRTRKPADIRKCAHAVATLHALESGGFLLDPYYTGHEYWQAVLEYAYFTDMLAALARGDGYSRKFPSERRLPSALVFPVPAGTPLRTREPAVPRLGSFSKSVATDIREVDLDGEHFDPMA